MRQITKIPALALTFLLGTLIVACGGSSSPEEQVAEIAKEHLVALSEFNAVGICGPMGSEATEDFADAGDDVEGWETATERAFCEYVYESNREEYEELEGEDRDAAIAASETLRGVEMEPASIDADGISATVTSKPFSVEVQGEEKTGQIWYSMTKENGSWLINEAVIFEEGDDPADGDGSELFPG